MMKTTMMRQTFFFSAITIGQALALGLSPLEIDVLVSKDKASIQSVKIENTNKAPTKFQAKVFKWSRRDGVEQLEETREVNVTPAMVEVKPKGTQIMRVVRVSNQPVEDQESYRLVVTEVPAPKLFLKRNQIGVQMVSSFSIPVLFTNPDAKPNLVWTVKRVGDRLQVQATNQGNRQIKVGNLFVKDGNKLSLGLDSTGSARILKKTSEKWVSKPIKKGFEVGKTVTLETKKSVGIEPLKVTATIVKG